MQHIVKPLAKLKWQDKIKQADEYHKGMCRGDSTWTITKTANELGYGYATMAEYLLVAQYIKTHPRIERFDTFDEALKYSRKLKRELRLAE